MTEPSNRQAVVDAAGDTWVRCDEYPGRDGNWWPITDGPRWEQWGRNKVGQPRSWPDLAEYGPFTEADGTRTERALGLVRQECETSVGREFEAVRREFLG